MKAALAVNQFTRIASSDGNGKIDVGELANIFAQVDGRANRACKRAVHGSPCAPCTVHHHSSGRVVRVAQVDGVTAHQAYTIAWTVLDYADTDFVVKDSKFTQIKRALGCMKKTDALTLKQDTDAKAARPLPKSNTSAGAAAADSGEGLDFAEFMTCIEGDSIEFSDFLKRLPAPPEDKIDYKVVAEVEEHFRMNGKPIGPPFGEMSEEEKAENEAEKRSSFKNLAMGMMQAV